MLLSKRGRAIAVCCMVHVPLTTANLNRDDRYKPDPSGDALSLGVIIFVSSICCVFVVGIIIALWRYFGDACCHQQRTYNGSGPAYHDVKFKELQTNSDIVSESVDQCDVVQLPRHGPSNLQSYIESHRETEVP